MAAAGRAYSNGVAGWSKSWDDLVKVWIRRDAPKVMVRGGLDEVVEWHEKFISSIYKEAIQWGDPTLIEPFARQLLTEEGIKVLDSAGNTRVYGDADRQRLIKELIPELRSLPRGGPLSLEAEFMLTKWIQEDANGKPRDSAARTRKRDVTAALLQIAGWDTSSLYARGNPQAPEQGLP